MQQAVPYRTWTQTNRFPKRLSRLIVETFESKFIRSQKKEDLQQHNSRNIDSPYQEQLEKQV